MWNGRSNSMALRDRLNKRRAKRDESLSAPILTQEQKNAQSEALGAQQEAQMSDNLKQAKVVETPITTPAPQETQGEVIETPKEGNVLTPEQTAAARDRMRAEAAEQLAQSGKENLQRLNLSQIQKMTAEASERGRKDIEERENKKRRREALFGALGDGIAAMANLYFTSKGAPNVKYNSTLSEAQQARWDKIDAQRKADEEQAYLYYQNDLKRQIDERKTQQEAAKEQRAEERYQEEKQRQERWRAEDKAEREATAKREEEKWKATLASQERRDDADRAGLNYRAELSAQASADKAKAASAKSMRGKPMQFSDGESKISIYENVWKPSMQQVYEAMKADGITDAMLEYGATSAQVEHFVKQNWNKSAKAKELMKVLSQIDPAAEYGEVKEDEVIDYDPFGFIDYNPEDEPINYVPNKK